MRGASWHARSTRSRRRSRPASRRGTLTTLRPMSSTARAPTIYNWPSPQGSARLTAGLVMTVEPMLVAGRPELAVRSDGWTVETVDGSLAAHEEHTIVVTDRGPVILTLA